MKCDAVPHDHRGFGQVPKLPVPEDRQTQKQAVTEHKIELGSEFLKSLRMLFKGKDC